MYIVANRYKKCCCHSNSNTKVHFCTDQFYTHLGKGCDVGLVSNMAAAVWEDTCTALHHQTELATQTVQHASVTMETVLVCYPLSGNYSRITFDWLRTGRDSYTSTAGKGGVKSAEVLVNPSYST